MSLVSDVYLSRERATQIAASVDLNAREVEYLAGQIPGGQFGDLREQALAASGALARIAELLATGQGPVRLERGTQLREIGVNTRRGLKRLAGNRGKR